MPGIYIHIPFCRKLCFYCDFHFTVSFRNKDILLDSICREVLLRKDDWKDVKFDTIYFGGGTPSVLSTKETGLILKELYTHFSISENCEITLEANPDDLIPEYLESNE